MNVQIVQLLPENWKQFFELRCEAIQSDPHAFRMAYEDELKLTEEQWRNFLANMWFAFVDDRIVGMIGILRESSLIGRHCAQIISFWVRPEFRGKGIGAKLIQYAQSYAQTHGIKKIYLHVNDTQEAAIALYEKLGFKNVGCLKQHAKYGDEYVDTYVMEWFNR